MTLLADMYRDASAIVAARSAIETSRRSDARAAELERERKATTQAYLQSFAPTQTPSAASIAPDFAPVANATAAGGQPFVDEAGQFMADAATDTGPAKYDPELMQGNLDKLAPETGMKFRESRKKDVKEAETAANDALHKGTSELGRMLQSVTDQDSYARFKQWALSLNEKVNGPIVKQMPEQYDPNFINQMSDMLQSFGGGGEKREIEELKQSGLEIRSQRTADTARAVATTKANAPPKAAKPGAKKTGEAEIRQTLKTTFGDKPRDLQYMDDAIAEANRIHRGNPDGTAQEAAVTAKKRVMALAEKFRGVKPGKDADALEATAIKSGMESSLVKSVRKKSRR
jgi:hypothetical protein